MASIHKHLYRRNGMEKSILLFCNPESYNSRDHMTLKVSLDVWGIERSGFFNGREKWAKGFENQRV